jgi:hypothetical protein
MAAAQYANRNAVEVEGAGKNKAQLIVGIDFVSVCARRTESSNLTAYRVLRSPESPSPLRQTPKPRKTSSQSGQAPAHIQSRRYYGPGDPVVRDLADETDPYGLIL